MFMKECRFPPVKHIVPSTDRFIREFISNVEKFPPID
jgi:hypothetical protein